MRNPDARALARRMTTLKTLANNKGYFDVPLWEQALRCIELVALPLLAFVLLARGGGAAARAPLSSPSTIREPHISATTSRIISGDRETTRSRASCSEQWPFSKGLVRRGGSKNTSCITLFPMAAA